MSSESGARFYHRRRGYFAEQGVARAAQVGVPGHVGEVALRGLVEVRVFEDFAEFGANRCGDQGSLTCFQRWPPPQWAA